MENLPTPHCTSCPLCAVYSNLIELNKAILNIKKPGKIKKEVFDRKQEFQKVTSN